jgi:flagellar hook protein FlgE
MGLASALSTALTGIGAAETQIDVIGNNVANSQTVGFKASKAIFATQFQQTLSLGAAPTTDNGGTNPRQVGLGVQVAEISPDFTQGTIQISSSPSDLAIQGDGFFMVQGNSGERLYTRNGIFKLNSENQLVNSTGQRLLGYGVDELFRLQETELTPLSIPLGTESVAKATTEVTLEGSLTPQGDLSTTAQVIESAVLGDAGVPRPVAAGVDIGGAPVTSTTGVTVTTAAGSLAAGTYQYRLAFVDSSGRESTPSGTLSATVGAGGSVQLGNLPTTTDTDYPAINVYRSGPTPGSFQLVGSSTPGGTFTDNGSATPGATLDSDTLTGNYTYMITYFKSGEPETRPSELIGPQNIVGSRIKLSDFPAPPTPPPGGGFPAYDEIRIYRNLAGDQNNFYLVDSIAPGEVFTDSRTDAEISNLSTLGNQLLNPDGPSVDSNTLLTSVLKRDGLSYQQLFTEGTLSFSPRKGGRAMEEKSFTVTSTSTMQDLLDFIEQASGIQTVTLDSQNPIPNSENNITGETGTLLPGAYIEDGRIRIVGNNGELNAIEVDLSAFQMTDAAGEVTVPNLAFGVSQEAEGASAVTDVVVYDSLGIPINVRVTAVLEARTDSETVYRWFADSGQNQTQTGANVSVGTGLVKFDGNGNLVSVTNNTINIQRDSLPSVSPLQFDLDFSRVSGLATPKPSLAATRQDGSAPGTLSSYVIGEDGGVRGVFSNGVTRDLGQVRLARFANPAGLDQRGENLYAQGINTGLPVEGQPGENGIGTVVAGAVELSNTDIGQDLVDLVLASTQYRGNTRVITTTQQLLDELLNLRR